MVSPLLPVQVLHVECRLLGCQAWVVSRRVQAAVGCVVLIGLMACDDPRTRNEKLQPRICTQDWFRYVERELRTSDAHGHGPDVGSLEWKSVVEFKLGIRGEAQVPSPETRDWCEFVKSELEKVR